MNGDYAFATAGCVNKQMFANSLQKILSEPALFMPKHTRDTWNELLLNIRALHSDGHIFFCTYKEPKPHDKEPEKNFVSACVGHTWFK